MQGRWVRLLVALSVIAVVPGCLTFQPDVRAPQRAAPPAARARPSRMSLPMPPPAALALPISVALALPQELASHRERSILIFGASGFLPVGATLAQQLSAACAHVARRCDTVRTAAEATGADLAIEAQFESVDVRSPPLPLMNWEVRIELDFVVRSPDGRTLARERLAGFGIGDALSGITTYDSGAVAVANAAADLTARFEQGFATWPGVASWLASRMERGR